MKFLYIVQCLLRFKEEFLIADYSSFGLQDKIAIVTGPSQGIGRAIAMGLAQAGRITYSPSIQPAGMKKSGNSRRKSKASAGGRCW